MRSWRKTVRYVHAAAWMAMALLSFAVVRSTVMQAAELAGAPTPACGMANMAATSGMAGRAPGKAHKACAFCAVAGHAPVCASTPAPQACATFAWFAWRSFASLGPRGPPAFTPRARGPPTSPLTT